MLTKIPVIYWKVLCVLFTSILAPLGIRHFDAAGGEPPPADAVPAVTPDVLFQDLSPATGRFLARGTGPTPDAAFQAAVDAAVHQAVAAEVSAADWRRHGPAYLAAVRRDGTGVLRGWHEVATGSEPHLTGRVFRAEVAVEVDVEALRDCLTTVGPVAYR